MLFLRILYENKKSEKSFKGLTEKLDYLENSFVDPKKCS